MRKIGFRCLMLLALLAPPLVQTGCLQQAAYQVRLGSRVREHVYTGSRSKLVEAARSLAEEKGWKVKDSSDDDSDLVGERKKSGQPEKLYLKVAKGDDGSRVTADVETEVASQNGKQTRRLQSTDFELALLEKVDPEAVDKVKAKAKKDAKEDAKMIRACARRAIDADEKADE